MPSEPYAELVGVVESDGEVIGVIESDGEIAAELESVIYINDHTKLHNRDKPNQHPIEAITNLRDELDAKISESDISLIYCGTSTEVI